MPAITTRGAASAKAFGWSSGGGPGPYIEEVFSTYLYTGTGATQTITNGIDLSTKGGMVWLKSRSAAFSNALFDTSRGTTKALFSDSTVTTQTYVNSVTAFNSTGFTMGNETLINQNTTTFCSWTFREQPKFFDVVTWTGTGSNTTIAHALGSVPGCIIVKRTDTAAAWAVYHRSLANTQYLVLNDTAAAATGATWWNSTTPTSSVFSVGTDASVNASGGTYVAYIYAHDAGGFGLTGADNVISCGSTTGGGGTVNLGYEPQWLLMKKTNGVQNWFLMDNMRGLNANLGEQALSPNLSSAEPTASSNINITSTGFINSGLGSISDTYIYIAIRRGPMKVPTVGTSVFSPVARTGTDVNTVISGIGFATDLLIGKYRGYTNGPYAFDRLRGATATSVNVRLSTTTGAEISGQDSMVGLGNTSVTVGVDTYAYNTNNSISTLINYFFGRAPSFLDIVCDTGTGVSHTVTHNLGVAPELILRKVRSAGSSWSVYYGSAGNYLQLDTTAASAADATIWDNTVPTSSVFSVGGTNLIANASGYTYVSYLFATCARVSKVGTYTGNGSNQTIDCGFTAGSRFVMIKRTSAAGDWYVWDSARGIAAGNDPHISFNTTAVEVTTDDSVDTDNSGFIVNQLAATNINVTSATYIFLAIA